MKLQRLAFAAAILLPSVALTASSSVASAQPGGYPPPAGQQGGYPPPANQGYYSQGPTQLTGGFQPRNGHLIYGSSFGIGGMKANDGPIDCASCDYNPIAVEVDAHIGGMLSDRFGLMLELQANVQTVDDTSSSTTTLGQVAAMVAAQYFVTPRFYVKGGLGVAHLSYSYDDNLGGQATDDVGDGSAVLLGAGYEILQGRNFALDLQARFIAGSYKNGTEDRISSGTIGIGVNWF